MIEPGTIQTATVMEKQQKSYLLNLGTHHVRLPEEEAVDDLNIGDSINVFIYTDKAGKPAATMRLPEATAASYGWADVAAVVPALGVFVNLHLPKDILVPKDDLPFMQDVWPQPNDQLYVILSKDKQGRLLARPAKENVILEQSISASKDMLNEHVTGRVYRAGKVGSFIWTDGQVRAFLHHQERRAEPRMGEEIEARVIDVKDDGTINISQRPDKLESMDEDAHAILLHLSRHRGEIPFSDKSDPEAIQETFHISKAAFKRAVGRLMKRGLIEQTKSGTIRTK
ncbi:CvfB family protein [Salibacterium aidingense]|uniref:CvfB family protein n=1 Tax=Salibacterium aidingense TaxID=384933 RepID=UPI0004278A4B|nr:S1-like domain-containing RNA-binding protein [Salibacterium aidingense]